MDVIYSDGKKSKGITLQKVEENKLNNYINFNINFIDI